MLDAPREHRRFTLEEYFWLEERSPTRNEFLDGQILTKTGGSLNHNRLINNLMEQLRRGLRGGKCEAFQSDVRLYVKASQLITYPDIVVLCGKTPLMEGRSDTLTDARMILEVLSPSTRHYDRTTKFELYRAVPSLQEYVVVDQDEIRLEQHQRQPGGEWLWKELRQGHLELTSLELRIALSEVFSGVRPG